MKIIFLDIDGVLNRIGPIEKGRTITKNSHGTIGLDLVLVKTLLHILKETGAEVVLSSTWRKYEDLRKDIFDAGILISDITPEIPGMARGFEIEDWLNEFECEKYAIIDDDSDMLPEQLPNFFQTSFEYGLTNEIANKIMLHLGPPQKSI